MFKAKKNKNGFAVLELVLAIVVIAIIAVGGWGVYKHYHKTKSVATTTNTMTSKTNTTQQTDPYAGWQTYCDTYVSACYKYPSDWTAVSGFSGVFQNTAITAYASLGGGTNKDQSTDSVYINSINNLSTVSGLSIVGYIAPNNKPIYALYDTSYLSTNRVTAGATSQLIDGNYAFTGKNGAVSFVATPGSNGYAAITTLDQAKAWFSSTNGETDLKIMQSFYYQ
jgi:Tfp pilus assembly major pilin PilA